MAPVRFGLIFCVLLLTACAATSPRNTGNICTLFDDKTSWYRAAIKSEERWGIPVPVSMAFIQQESAFVARAKPPRTKIFGFIPGPRASSAVGYAQALDSTWEDYKEQSGNNPHQQHSQRRCLQSLFSLSRRQCRFYTSQL